eukprot:8788934-Pyramimonas_sp.AAC.1
MMWNWRGALDMQLLPLAAEEGQALFGLVLKTAQNLINRALADPVHAQQGESVRRFRHAKLIRT